jgi:alpha-N-arabinofuranosidase
VPGGAAVKDASGHFIHEDVWRYLFTHPVEQVGQAVPHDPNGLSGGWDSSTGQAWYEDVALEQIEAPPEDTTASVTIDTAARTVPYSRMIFGGFIEHFDGQVYGGLFEPGSPLADQQGFRKDVLQAVKELKVSVVRWPGGCFASGYHWKDGVGANRKPTPDPVWGVVDPNTFGTDEFVDWCRLAGCEPYICTNAGNGTSEEMKEWVKYCNGTQGPLAELRKAGRHDRPLDVRYWSIGNENWGGHEIGARTPKEWGPLVERSAELMLSADPNLKLLAAATPDRRWTLPLLNAAGRHLDYVCIHGYWLGFWAKNEMPDYASCIMQSEGPERTLRQVIEVLQEAGCRGRIKIAFDEWNLRGWHHPGFPRKETVKEHDADAAALVAKREINAIASQYTMADALFSASFLNACLRHAADVGMANIAPLVNTRGPLYVYPGGIVKRTTFHTLAVYANELESHVGKLDLKAGNLFHDGRSIPMVDAVATVDDSGSKWSIALVNRHPSKNVACTIRMKDVPPDGHYEAVILDGDSPEAFNDVEHPNRVMPRKTSLTLVHGLVDLPPHSLVIVKIPQEGAVVERKAACPPLLFASEGAKKIVILAGDGSVSWEYPAEMSRDAWRLPNGNILFCYNNQYNSGRNDNPSGVIEVTPDKKEVFHFRTTGQVWSCQRLADGNTLVGAASQGKLLVVDPQGQVVRSIKLKNNPRHSCLRNARQLANGNFLVAEESAHAVREYSPDGTMVREIPVQFPTYSAVRLPNGNTITCGRGAMVEIDPGGQTVWSLLDREIPEMGVRWIAGIQVLPDGNIFVCNAGGKIPFFEVDRQKHIVWQWPSSGGGISLGHGIQRLDIPGVPLK